MNLRFASLVAIALFAAAAVVFAFASDAPAGFAIIAGGTMAVIAAGLLVLTMLAARWRATDARSARQHATEHDAASLYDDLLADSYEIDDAIVGDAATG